MFPLEYQVNIHHNDGAVHKYALVENQNDTHLVVINPTVVTEMQAYVSRGGQRDDGLIALLMDEAMVLDRSTGALLPLEEATDVMEVSQFAPVRRAAMLRKPLPERHLDLSGEDLAWAFGLEIARRAHAS
ncbi:MAG: hypothetical protein JWM80_6644 [Cyanobacteria bacterium RYN_339]|nr:hypothetical protein [Cyanobacteria bacterium RYN_339]